MNETLSKYTNRTEIIVNKEPQLTSADPEERILARRLRTEKRNALQKKKLQVEENVEEVSVEEDEEEAVLEKQVEKSTVELLTLTGEGEELISNVQVAADNHEVSRRGEQAADKAARLNRLEEEASISQHKFDVINSKWENITMLKDPLDLHRETEVQREKCIDLLKQKDELIAELKAELKAGDVRFIKDQQRQAEDITLLVERIDSQIAVMRRAYRRELLLIEQAIDIERKETMEVNNKRWEILYKQREEDELNNLEKRTEALSEHNKLVQDIMVHHQEKFRATKISLEKDIQVLQQQLEQVKAICLLNKEKMEYNYQVLKKRDEESLLIRSQQKRRINKLQDVVTTLRRKIIAMEKSTQGEIKRLTSEVIKLHRNIKEIRLKADHFCLVNETKYFQLWKFNHDSAKKLLDRIFSIDRLVHEQHLGIPWQPVTYVAVSKQNLPSYKTAVDKSTNEVAVIEKSAQNLSCGTTDELVTERLRCILEAVADRSGFLVEERLNILLAPYTRSQNILVRIDNVFNALGVTQEEDMEVLRQCMEPYLVCATCQPMLETVRPISPPTSPPPCSATEEEVTDQVERKTKIIIEEEEKLTNIRKEKLLHEDGSSVRKKFRISETGVPSYTPWAMASSTNLQQQSCLKFPYSSTSGKLTDKTVCHDPTHKQIIHPVFVLQALREFIEELRQMKKGSHPQDNMEDKNSISRQLSDSDVKAFWEQFRAAFPSEREKVWDCLHLGLQKYHTVLQERYKVNSDIQQLRLQNMELRRLLQKYALPNNMKSSKGPRQNLPPLQAVKTSRSALAPTPAPTPARLILTFDNSSRL